MYDYYFWQRNPLCTFILCCKTINSGCYPPSARLKGPVRLFGAREYCWLNFPRIRFFWYYLWCLLSILLSITFIFNIITTQKITYSYWFTIIFFFVLKKVPNMSNYSSFNWFIFFFQPKKISYIFNSGNIYLI